MLKNYIRDLRKNKDDLVTTHILIGAIQTNDCLAHPRLVPEFPVAKLRYSAPKGN